MEKIHVSKHFEACVLTLTLTTTILDSPKNKVIADNNLNVAQMIYVIFQNIGNILRKVKMLPVRIFPCPYNVFKIQDCAKGYCMTCSTDPCMFDFVLHIF